MYHKIGKKHNNMADCFKLMKRNEDRKLDALRTKVSVNTLEMFAKLLKKN